MLLRQGFDRLMDARILRNLHQLEAHQERQSQWISPWSPTLLTIESRGWRFCFHILFIRRILIEWLNSVE